MIRIKRGLDLPIEGEPDPSIHAGNTVKTVALVGADYVGMKPTMEVQEGDAVKLGQLLFIDKKTPGVRYTSPGAGRIAGVHRGQKRRFLSIVIDLEGEDEETFASYDDRALSGLDRDAVVENLVQSGLWTSLRARPYSKVPPPDGEPPRSIFVSAMDTHPLAPDPVPILESKQAMFARGLRVLGKLTEGKVWLCKRPGVSVPGADVDGVATEEFEGPHPAGLPGTHMHFLDPVSEKRISWWVGYQDVIAIGHLFATGRLLVDRIVSLAGPSVKEPRLLRTRMGASLDDLSRDELREGMNRIVSGSVLSGRTAAGPEAYLGRYHHQVSVLEEGTEREFLGWQKPGFDKYSIKGVFASALGPGRRFAFTTSTQGSRRAIVPIGSYEKVMPLDIVATVLLKALITEDTEQAQLLGALELDEEDLALCTFVCPGKYEYGEILRRNLTRIEQEG